MKHSPFNKTLIIGSVLILVEIILGFVFVGIFSSASEKHFSELAFSEMNREVKDSALEFSDDLGSVSDYLRMAIMLSGGDEDIMTSPEFLEKISENTLAYSAVYLDENNTAYDAGGNTFDLSKADYIDMLREGKTIYCEDNGIDDKKCFVIPCDPGEGSEGRLLAYLDAAVFDDNVAEDEAFRYSFYVLLDKKHESVYSTGKTANLILIEGSLWDNLKRFAVNEEKWNLFSDMYDSGAQYILEIIQYKIQRYIAFYPVENTDWTLLVGYDKSFVRNTISTYFNPGKAFKGEMIGCFIVIFITFGVFAALISNTTYSSSKELTGKAETDLLTGVNNKISTEAKIKEYISANAGGQGVFILIDVDNFKKVNDTMGHAFGDEVLRNLGMRLKTLYRATDIIGRVGGDEFIVFLKDISDMGIIQREARKLEVFFRGFEVGEYTKYSVNASLGASIYPMDGQTFEALYKNADAALYYVKQHGKNKLSFYKEDEKFPPENEDDGENY